MAGELSHVRAVLFDFDDTLVETLPGRQAAIGRAFEEAGVTSPTAAEFVQSINGLTFNAPFAELDRIYGRELRLLDRYRAAYWLHEAENAPTYQGIAAMLQALHDAGRSLALATSKVREFEVQGRRVGATYQIERSGLSGFFPIVVGAEDVSQHKPHPEVVLTALERLGVAPGDALMVGDSTADIGAAIAAGCWSCHATWGGGPPGPAVDGAEPHHVAKTPADVLCLLGVG